VTTFDVASGATKRETTAPASVENRIAIIDEDTGALLVDRPLAPYGSAFQRYHEPHQGTFCGKHIVFTARRSGLLAVFRLSDGELVYQYEHPHEIFRAAHDGNRLYVRSSDGTLAVLEAEGGEL
jgi:hypothetical protein